MWSLETVGLRNVDSLFLEPIMPAATSLHALSRLCTLVAEATCMVCRSWASQAALRTESKIFLVARAAASGGLEPWEISCVAGTRVRMPRNKRILTPIKRLTSVCVSTTARFARLTCAFANAPAIVPIIALAALSPGGCKGTITDRLSDAFGNCFHGGLPWG